MINLGIFIDREKMLKSALHVASVCTDRHDVPHEVEIDGAMVPVPTDVDNRAPRFLGLANGRSVSGRVIADETARGGPSPAVPVALAMVPVATALAFALSALWPPLGHVAVVLLALAITATWLTAGFGTGLLALIFAGLALGGTSTLGTALGSLPFGGDLLHFAPVVLLAVGIFAFSAYGRGALWAVFGAIAAMVTSKFAPHLVQPLLLFAPITLLPWIWAWVARDLFARHLAENDTKSGLGEWVAFSRTANKTARQQQAEVATRDKSLWIRLGVATGWLAAQFDAFAPDEGSPFGFSVLDNETHHLTLGSTGRGKTSSLLRPYIYQLSQAERREGMLIQDAKAALAAEIRGLLGGYTLIEPGKVKLALFEGLNAQEVAQTIVSTAAAADEKKASGNGAHFIGAAKTLLSHLTVLLDVLVRAKYGSASWTPRSLYDLLVEVVADNFAVTIADEHFEDKIVLGLNEGERDIFRMALQYFAVDFPAIPANERGSVVNSAREWIVPVLQHPDLIAWAQTPPGPDTLKLDAILHGAAFGIALPEVRYNRAGPLIQNLLRQRVYSMLGLRANVNKDWRERGETHVVFVVDEAQDIVTEGDVSFLALARSLGGIAHFAMQNIDIIYARFGESKAKAFLDNFQSVTVLKSSPATHEWMSRRLDGAMRPQKEESGTVIDYQAALTTYASTALTDPDHPYADVMRRLRRQGAGEIVDPRALGHINDKASMMGRILPWMKPRPTADRMRINAPVIAGWKFGWVMEPGEIGAVLATKGFAVSQVMRGGELRRDVIRLKPMDEFPKPKEATHEAA